VYPAFAGPLLVALAKKAKKLPLASSCLSAWNNSASTGRIFMKFLNLVIFRKFVEEIQGLLMSVKNYGHFA
jgi:hypothetical protein